MGRFNTKLESHFSDVHLYHNSFNSYHGRRKVLLVLTFFLLNCYAHLNFLCNLGTIIVLLLQKSTGHKLFGHQPVSILLVVYCCFRSGANWNTTESASSLTTTSIWVSLSTDSFRKFQYRNSVRNKSCRCLSRRVFIFSKVARLNAVIRLLFFRTGSHNSLYFVSVIYFVYYCISGPFHHWLFQAGVSSVAYQSQTFISLERHRWVGSNCAIVCCTHLKNRNEFDRRILALLKQ